VIFLLVFEVVKATPRDAFVLSVFAREYFDYAQLTHAKILARLHSANYEYWIAKNDGATIGFIDVDFTPVKGLRKDAVPPTTQNADSATTDAKARREAKRKGTPKAKKETQAKILGLAVLPEFRGRGVAKRLIAKAMARAKARGCKEIFLLVKEDNAAAQALYAKLHFFKRGVLAEKLWGKTILLYAKVLRTAN
jgi:ribosomal protein S18 acetylase RimI-like enzyme